MGETGQTTDPHEAKRLARREARLAMEGLSLGQAAEGSQAVCRLILESTAWQKAGQAMLYMPISGELDLKSLMKKGLETGKSIALPRFSVEKNLYEACAIANLGDLMPGKFGIPEHRAVKKWIRSNST
jgi:5-formyltetrahydrofolate cyclo-ligase